MSVSEQRIDSHLKDMDDLFHEFYTWLAGQYDLKTGGFYYAKSSIDAPELEPDIESTAQALNIIDRSELLKRIPDAMRQAMIRFFQNKQDPESGFFYDSDPNMRKDEVMVSRAIGYSLGCLRRLGGEPLYPMTYDPNQMPAFMESVETYIGWLKQVDLRNSWRGCDFMTSANHFVYRLPEPQRTQYIEAAKDYFASIQDPETGFWGGGNRYIRISGTFKLNAFYERFHIPMPNVDKIYQSILTTLREDEALDMCWVRNPIDLLGTFKNRLNIPREELAEIFEITVKNMRALRRPDGGFSRELKHSPVAPNVAQVKEGEFYPNMPIPVPLGRGLKEGDMNAGTQALWIRTLSYKLADRTAHQLVPYTDQLIEELHRKFE
jgi:hypothetical protein